MVDLTDEMISELQWGDAKYFGYYWDSTFTEPTLIIRIAPANSPTLELVCNWATHLKVEIDYNKHVNSLLTWEVKFKKLPNALWEVDFDFGSNGYLKFECNRLAERQISGSHAI